MYYLDMYFPSEEDLPDFGSLHLTWVGGQILGVKQKDRYGRDIDKRMRKYVFLSDDLNKLSLINNAADGSQAIAADTGERYILCEGTWNKVSRGSSGGGSCQYYAGCV